MDALRNLAEWCRHNDIPPGDVEITITASKGNAKGMAMGLAVLLEDMSGDYSGPDEIWRFNMFSILGVIREKK